MLFQRVPDTVGRQVAGQEHDGVLVQWYVTESRVGLLEHGVQHVLHRVSTLGVLVEHDDDGLLLVNLEPSVRVVARGLGFVVDHRHRNVAQVHVGYVDIRMVITQVTCHLL